MIGPQLADDNLIESFRMHARWQEPAELQEHDGMLMIAGCNSRPGLYRNCALRLDPSVPAGKAFEQTMRFFGSRERGFTLVTRKRFDDDMEKLLADASIFPRGSSPCMIINRELEPAPLPEGVYTVAITDQEQLRDSVQVNMEAYPRLGMAAEEVAAFFRNGDRVMDDNVSGLVAYKDGVPLATALTYVTGPSAGVYWVGTVAAAERQGLAGACTRLAVNAGFEQGARVVTLQASPFGLPVYQRLGFQNYDGLSFYFFGRSQVS
ncbi:GNAT family N-acetyltransferase [Marinobacter sp. LN3S78]|uniref:GNAT family N-acetyltransferase n=1 Tax=Marinobacter sp. LN3S78 TaxID=3382300 RepID=UPI00387B0E33